jgi:hypothetical protein
MYQPPGDGNALGRLRFNTPNQFLVYLHDTPDKKLFDRDQRTFSAGCMRVQDPVKFAEVVLSIVQPNENYTQERVRRMYGNSEINHLSRTTCRSTSPTRPPGSMKPASCARAATSTDMIRG